MTAQANGLDDLRRHVTESAFETYLRARAPLFAPEIVPSAMQQGFLSPDFSASQLRGFLSYCERRPISEWCEYVMKARKKKRSPWAKQDQQDRTIVDGFLQALNTWQSGQALKDQWGALLQECCGNELDEGLREKLVLDEGLRKKLVQTLALEALDAAIRRALREKERAR